jgi:hypothetical protein
MSSDSHRSTSTYAGIAGRSSFAGTWRFYAWRFI